MDQQGLTRASPTTMTSEGMTSGLTKSGVIPLRHASLPGHLKLPRRYEKAAMGTKGVPSRLRKMSIQPSCSSPDRSALGESLSDRLHDLMAAIMWLKQELIMLRQHDILLKRQFFDIQHSIHTLQKPKTSVTSQLALNRKATAATTTTSTTSGADLSTDSNEAPPSVPPHAVTGLRREQASSGSHHHNHNHHHHHGNHHELHPDHNTYNDINDDSGTNTGSGDDGFMLEAYVVRPCSSVTMLNDNSEDDDDDDLLDDDSLFRPRTNSMMTSRDMAALARRRGSKELI